MLIMDHNIGHHEENKCDYFKKLKYVIYIMSVNFYEQINISTGYRTPAEKYLLTLVMNNIDLDPDNTIEFGIGNDKKINTGNYDVYLDNLTTFGVGEANSSGTMAFKISLHFFKRIIKLNK